MNNPQKYTSMKRLLLIIAAFLLAIVISIACVYYLYTTSNPRNAKTIGELSLPVGYKRVPAEKGSYAAWLRSLPLKKRGTKVYTYKNRELANFQWLSTGVVDMPLLTNDEQCADVCMRMRAEYLFSTGQYSKISFPALNGEKLTYTGGNNRNAFEKYLRNVFGRCNTTSLHHSLKTRKLGDMQIGDIFVYPHRMIAGKNRYGHAVMVADMAVNKRGKKIFILIEGNTPARDIHVLRNLKLHHNPWFHLDEDDETLYLNVFRFQDTDLKYF